MTHYTLYNKVLDKRLTHPIVGLWYTKDLDEARAMLKACHQYTDTLSPDLKQNFVIIDVETGAECQ